MTENPLTVLNGSLQQATDRQRVMEQLLLEARAWPWIIKDGRNDWAIAVDRLFNPLLGGIRPLKPETNNG